MQRETSVEQLRRFVAKWMARGNCELVSAGEYADRWFINACMRCVRPVRATYLARYSLGKRARKPLKAVALYSCRKCDECERSNSMRWAARASDEFDMAARTWFGTLTLDPAHHALVDQWVAEANEWPDKSRLSDEQFKSALFRARCKMINSQVDSWLDIVREVSYLRTHKRTHERPGVSKNLSNTRYLIVAERHDSAKTQEWMRGRPHFHLVLHEAIAGAAFKGEISGVDNAEIVFRKKRVGDEWKPAVYASDQSVLRQAWVLGHSTFEYCFDRKAAFYVCKYMYQCDMARVRASQYYGTKAGEQGEPGDGGDQSKTPLTPPVDKTELRKEKL